MNPFSMATCLAEESTELEMALEGVTKEEALVGGTVMGVAIGMAIAIGIFWFILQVIADWKIFKKAGRPGWKSIIPFLNYYEEFDLSWKGRGMLGLLYSVLMAVSQVIDYATADPTPTWAMIVMAVIGVVAIVLIFMQSMRLARSFGKGAGFGVGLFLLGPIFRLILGFGSAEYIGAQD